MNDKKKAPLFVYFVEGIPGYNNDDPTKCTSVKSIVKGNFKRVKTLPKQCIILDVTADTLLSQDDLKYAKNGVCIIDGPWYVMPEVILKIGDGHIKRKLPPAIACNPHHKGATMISSVEAMALALHILGYTDQAEHILKPFSWAKDFFKPLKL
jgi:ribosome biogenesis protein Tsr3